MSGNINNNKQNRVDKKKNLIYFPRSFIEESKIVVNNKKSNSIDMYLQGELNINNSLMSTREYSDKIKKSRSSNNIKKHVSFNPKVKIINITKFKKETKKYSYQNDYSDSGFEDDFNDETEKKCLICSIF